MQKRGFSIGSVLLSYFMVAGGLFTGMLLLYAVKSKSEGVMYLFMALGSFVGGFVAARASRGSTVIEPAIGAIAVIITIVALAGSTALGKVIWHVDKDGVMKFVALMGGSCVVGALGGAFASEKMFGEATTSSVPWILYIAFAAFGACMMATMIASLSMVEFEDVDKGIGILFGGMAGGCLLSGIASGASSRVRPLLAALLGGSFGVAGFFLTIMMASRDRPEGDVIGGLVTLAVMGGVVSLIGALIGWFAIGKKLAAAEMPASAPRVG